MNDEETKELIQARNDGKKKDLRIRETDGMFMQEGRMYVPNNAELKKEILDEAHVSTYAMHPGVDRLTKSAHFIPVREKYSLSRLAELFISKIVTYHGVPVSIISDPNPRFTSKFWVAFQEALEVGERVLVGPEIVEQTTQNIQVFLKLSPWRGVVQFGKKGNLSPRYNESYQIIERVCEVAYRLGLLPKLSKVHDVFHVSILRHYISDPSHVIPLEPLEINSDLTYDEKLVTILDWKDKVLRNKTVRLVKVLWRNHSVEEAT
ncbi:unnamed protein product [Malus baccata var. baccata]